MLEAIRKVAFGPSSWALLTLTLASLGGLLAQWQETGSFPDAAAWRTAVLGIALAAIRTVQAVAQTRADEATIPGGVPIDPDPEEPAGHA